MDRRLRLSPPGTARLIRTTVTPWETRRPTRRLPDPGADDDGLRSDGGDDPADQGAEVLKIELPFTGIGPVPRTSPNGMAAMFATVNRNKKSVCLDLKVDEERAIFLDLVRTADALIENYRSGVLDRMGLGYEALSAIRPELVYASITGYGTGPYENRRVFDPLTGDCRHGRSTGWRDPENIRMIIFDKVTALTTARSPPPCWNARTGRGQYLPITMLESALSYQWPDVMWSAPISAKA